MAGQSGAEKEQNIEQRPQRCSFGRRSKYLVQCSVLSGLAWLVVVVVVVIWWWGCGGWGGKSVGEVKRARGMDRVIRRVSQDDVHS